MANSTLNIVVNEVIPVGGQITFNLQGTNITYNWVTTRNGANQVTKADTIPETLENFEAALNTDYPNLLSAFHNGTSSQIQITSDSPVGNFFNAESNGLNARFTIINSARPITILGLTGDNYLINNPIILQVQTTYPVERLTIKFTNLTNQAQSKEMNFYPSANTTSSLDISPHIKSMFTLPNHMSVGSNVPNVNTFEIEINFTGSFTPTTITKSFVRGGKRTFNSNQTIPLNTFLQPNNLYPLFTNYPALAYHLINDDNNVRVIRERRVDQSNGVIDRRRTKGCNQVYVKFLNQLGGYSFWLFDTYTETETATPNGSYELNNGLQDLGSDSDTKIQLTGKVPAEYIDLIKDLIISPEIYTYTNGSGLSLGTWRRIVLDKNSSIVKDLNKRAYSVKIGVSPEYRFNPSMIWQS